MSGRALGRLPRAFNQAIPHYSSLATGKRKALAPIPPKLDYLDRVPTLGMMCNDRLGCCTISGAYHARQIWTAVARGKEETPPDDQVVQTYSEFAGYVPGQPDTDSGAVEQEVLKRWLQVGLPVDQTRKHLLAFIEIDPRNFNDIKRAIWECGVVYIGFNVPRWLEEASTVPPVWKRKPNHTGEESVGGHCVVLGGYAKDTVHTVSWGDKYQIREDFFTKFVDEAYALVSEDWITETGKSPLGLTSDELTYMMKTVATDGI